MLDELAFYVGIFYLGLLVHLAALGAAWIAYQAFRTARS